MKQPKPNFNIDRMVADMTLRGWNNASLAAAARVSKMAVTRFLTGEIQTPTMAAKLAGALGHPVRRYFAGVKAA